MGRVAGRFTLAYLLLVTFWGGAAMSPTAFGFLDPDFTWSRWLGAPEVFGALSDLCGIESLSRWPGALFTFARWCLPGDDEAAQHQQYALASMLGGIGLPLVLCAAIGPKRAADLGLRRPPPAFWPVLAVALVALSPVVLALSLHPAFHAGVAERLSGSPWFLIAAICGAGAEHFFFHGVLLAWLHPSGVFVQVHEPFLWPGRATKQGPASLRRAIESLAIPRELLWPCLLSGPLFFVIHIGKPDSELWLSALAGPLLAWLAFRTGGLVAPLVVHLSASLLAACILLLVHAFA